MWIFPREEYDVVGQLTQRNAVSLIDNLKLNFIFLQLYIFNNSFINTGQDQSAVYFRMNLQ